MEIFVGFENRSTEQPYDLYIVRRAVVSVYALMPTTQLFIIHYIKFVPRVQPVSGEPKRLRVK